MEEEIPEMEPESEESEIELDMEGEYEQTLEFLYKIFGLNMWFLNLTKPQLIIFKVIRVVLKALT